jgi:putative phosphoesterase
MRIAVIADTHDRLPEHVLEDIRPADEIWHLGDVTSPAILARIRELGRPLRIVRGNCDSEASWPLVEKFVLEGFSIQLVHIPPPKADPGVQLLLHGHTHVPRNELVGSARFLNPGCITRPNQGAPASFAWLELERGKPQSWTIVKVGR